MKRSPQRYLFSQQRRLLTHESRPTWLINWVTHSSYAAPWIVESLRLAVLSLPTLKQLVDRGIKGNIRLRGDTKELYFTDPDGIRVQLQDVKYKGGTGPLGDKDPK